MSPDGVAVFALRANPDRPPHVVRLDARAADQEPVELRSPATPTGELPERADTGGDVEAALDARRMLAALPTPQRLVLVLRFWLDLSEQQTADALDCSLGTVKSRTSRALKALRENTSIVNGAR